MMGNNIFDEVPDEIRSQLVSFSEAIHDLSQLVKKISEIPTEVKDEVSNLDNIKADLSLCYTYNALFFIYLRCNGIETKNHEIMQELDRTMNALKRCRSLVEKDSSARLKLDKEATSRFVKHALWQSAHSKNRKRRADSDSLKSH